MMTIKNNNVVYKISTIKSMTNILSIDFSTSKHVPCSITRCTRDHLAYPFFNNIKTIFKCIKIIVG